MNTSDNTSITSRPIIIGGEHTVAENNRYGQIINLRQEFEQEPYRGAFQIVINSNNTVSVYDTSLADELRASELGGGGQVKLRWMEVQKDDQKDICLSYPRSRTVNVAGADNMEVTQSGYLYLQMRRTDGPGEISFSDDFLGDVHLVFNWGIAEELPQTDSHSEIISVGAVLVDDEGTVCDIVQQQFGPAELWIPPEKAAVQESDSPSISQDKSSSSNKKSESQDKSSSSNKKSDSSESRDFVRQVLVKLHYLEDGSELYDDGVTESWIYEVSMNGVFIADHSVQTDEYVISLEGTGTLTNKKNGYTSGFSIAFTVKFYRNYTTDRWEMTSEDGPYEWWVNNTTIEEGVKVIDVTTHQFPELATNPTAPLSTVKVDKIINTNQKLNSSFTMTFTQL